AGGPVVADVRARAGRRRARGRRHRCVAAERPHVRAGAPGGEALRTGPRPGPAVRRGPDRPGLATGRLGRVGRRSDRARRHGDRVAAVDPSDALTERLGLPVGLVESEATMAALGAASTPGADRDAAVLDLGAGT